VVIPADAPLSDAEAMTSGEACSRTEEQPRADPSGAATYPCSTDEQSGSGAGPEAQRRAIAAECERRGWQFLEVVEDPGFSAKEMQPEMVRLRLAGVRRSPT
jgi:hypothetical protein